MIIKVIELCMVDYIKEDDQKSNEELTATREVIYNSKKNTLVEAFQDYDSNNFDFDNVIQSNDNFDGECLDLVKYISVEEIEED